jgi:polyribonucleotide nucleotidyltransferase
MMMQPLRVECELDGKLLTLETGQVARQAGGAVIARMGDTMVLATVCVAAAREDMDFFPLTVDYREKTNAAGKIPGGFFKREGRPTTKETLTMRLIDRSIRPMFPDGYKQEVQVMSQVLGYDGEHPADILAMIASFAAVHISSIPFEGAMGAVRLGHQAGRFVLFPHAEKVRTDSRLDLVVAGHENAIAMVEASADQLPEADMIDALELSHRAIRQICTALDELRQKAGKPKEAFQAPKTDAVLLAALAPYRPAVADALFTAGKHERYAAVGRVKQEAVQALTQGYDGDALAARTKAVKAAWEEFSSKVERQTIVAGRRVDGRRWDEVRPIWIQPNFIPRNHGSVLFTRGETQALVSATLGSRDDEQIIDGLEAEYRKNFYLHYNFPPFSVGEVKRLGGPGRREIGHGMLAERSLAAVMPPPERFPYTVRIVSEITESNGSSSMASVCGGCLSMMLAGVPLKQPVAGIAMGLVEEDGGRAILSDIHGSEDHHGDMDFKVAGSGLGITALQMDIKVKGVSRELLEKALAQARDGRLHILRKMLEAVPRPSSEVSPWAPAMKRIEIPGDRIGLLIGPGGKNIKGLEAEHQVKISVVEESGIGKVTVAGVNREKLERAYASIQAMCETPKIGARYLGTVKGIKDFGAFVEILPGVEGMVHISELAEGYVEKVADVVAMGDKLEVVIINVDDRGKIKLSHRQTLEA